MEAHVITRAGRLELPLPGRGDFPARTSLRATRLSCILDSYNHFTFLRVTYFKAK